jgi:hypothetical protein
MAINFGHPCWTVRKLAGFLWAVHWSDSGSIPFIICSVHHVECSAYRMACSMQEHGPQLDQ